MWGRDSSVGTATRYGPDGPEFESRLGRVIPHPSMPVLELTQPPIQWVPGLCRGKAAGACRWPPTTSSADVKERVQLYLYSPSGPLWPVPEWSLPFPLLFNLQKFSCRAEKRCHFRRCLCIARKEITVCWNDLDFLHEKFQCHTQQMAWLQCPMLAEIYAIDCSPLLVQWGTFYSNQTGCSFKRTDVWLTNVKTST